MTDRKLTCAACKSAITKGDIAGSDLEFGGELKATNQPEYTADADTDLVATVGTLDEYTPMVRTTGNQTINGGKQFNATLGRGCTTANVLTNPTTPIGATIMSLVDQQNGDTHNTLGAMVKVRNNAGQNYIDLDNASYGYSEEGTQKRINAFLRLLIDETTGNAQLIFYRQKRNADGTGESSITSKVIATITYNE